MFAWCITSCFTWSVETHHIFWFNYVRPVIVRIIVNARAFASDKRATLLFDRWFRHSSKSHVRHCTDHTDCSPYRNKNEECKKCDRICFLIEIHFSVDGTRFILNRTPTESILFTSIILISYELYPIPLATAGEENTASPVA